VTQDPMKTQKKKSDPENLLWVEIIRAVMILGVVFIHTSADVVTAWKTLPRDWWWAGNIYSSLARGCVPVFVMVSGALLLPKSESISVFFSKRFSRIFVPFVAWSLFYFLWKKVVLDSDLAFTEAPKQIINDDVYFHLWFLYLIAGLYLVTPVFRVIAAHASERVILYFLFLWFILTSVIPFLGRIDPYLLHTGLDFSIPVEPAQGFIGYFVLGYFIRRANTSAMVPAVAAVWIASLLFCVLGTYLISAPVNLVHLLFYDNMSPNVVLYAASFFLLMKHAGQLLEPKIWPGPRKFVAELSKASFGIYLIHPVFIHIFEKGLLGFFLRSDSFHPVYMIPLNALMVYSLSFGVVYSVQKIPYLKNIV